MRKAKLFLTALALVFSAGLPAYAGLSGSVPVTISGSVDPSMLPGLTGAVTAPAGSNVTTIAPTGTTPGTYSCPSVTVNAAGQITAINSGTCGGSGRALLTGPLVQYVSATGTDTGNCETAGAPCATPTYIYAYDQKTFDLGSQTVTVEFQSSYSGIDGWTFIGPLVGALGPQSFVMDGGSPSSTTISATAAPAYLFFAQSGAQFTVQNFTLSSTGTGSADLIVSGGQISANSIWFGPTANAFVDTAGPTSLFSCGSGGLTFLLNSNPNIGFVAEDHSLQALGCPLIVSGSPNWTTAFVQADLGGMIDATNSTITAASATGSRYNVSQNGIIFTGGSGGPNYFPGSIAGTVSTGGYYQ